MDISSDQTRAGQRAEPAALLLGPTVASRCLELVALLKDSRLFRLRRQRKVSSPVYTPWHSLALQAPGGLTLVSLYEQMDLSQSRLIVDEAFLRALESVMRGPESRGLIIDEEAFESRLMWEVLDDPSEHRRRIEEAVTLLGLAAPWMKRQLDATVDCFVPIFHGAEGEPRSRSLTSDSAFGAIFITLMERTSEHARAQLAVDICHELGHHLLLAYQHCDPIIADKERTFAYSGIKGTLRPAMLSFHAACAMAFMIAAAEAILNHPTSTPAERQYLVRRIARLKRDLAETLDSLEVSCRFTPFGAELKREFRDFAA